MQKLIDKILNFQFFSTEELKPIAQEIYRMLKNYFNTGDIYIAFIEGFPIITESKITDSVPFSNYFNL